MKIGQLYILEEIGSFGVSAQDVIEQLKQFDEEQVDEIYVYINSPGGSVFEGLTIYNQLAARENVTTIIEGLAASMASVIALAGNKVIMRPSSLMLVHNPWTLAVGDVEELTKVGEDLDKVKNSIVSIYKEKTGMDDDEIKNLMNEDRYMEAKEAVKKGFADEIKSAKDSKSYSTKFVALSKVYDTEKSNQTEDNKMKKKDVLKFLGFADSEIIKGVSDEQIDAQIKSLREKYKLDEKASLLDVLDAHAAANPPKKTGDPKSGDEKIETSQIFETMKKLNQRVEEIENRGMDEKAETLVDAAINEYKILAADREIWLEAAKKDYEGTKKKLDAKEKDSMKPKNLKVGSGPLDMNNAHEVQMAIRQTIKEGKAKNPADALAYLKKNNN